MQIRTFYLAEGVNLDDSSTNFPFLENAVTFFKQHGYSEVEAYVYGGESEWDCGIDSYSATYPTLEEMSKHFRKDYLEEFMESSGWTLTVGGYAVRMKKESIEIDIFNCSDGVNLIGDDIEPIELFEENESFTSKRLRKLNCCSDNENSDFK